MEGGEQRGRSVAAVVMGPLLGNAGIIGSTGEDRSRAWMPLWTAGRLKKTTLTSSIVHI